MNYPSGPSDGELHARLNAFVQADAESETADEDTVRDEVQQLTGRLPAKASDEPDPFSWRGQRTADHRRMSAGSQARWESLRSILEPVLLVIAGSSLAISLMAARATTLTSAVAAAVATATVLVLVYVRTASHGWTTSRARADLLIRQWEREDARQAMTWERQDRLRELAYAREDALRRELWERQERELAHAREWEEFQKSREWEQEHAVREVERQDRLRHEELGVLKALVDRGHLDGVDIDELVRSLRTPVAVPSEIRVAGVPSIDPTPIEPSQYEAHAPKDIIEGTAPRPRLLIGQNCTVVHTDVVAFGADKRDDKARKIIKRETLAMTQQALGPAWDTCRYEDRGDGLVVIVPPDIPTAQVLERLVTVLPPELEWHNLKYNDSCRIQLRVAVDVGPIADDDDGVSGKSIISVSRMLEAPAFKEAMARKGAVLGVVVSPFVYQAHVALGGSLDPADYTEIPVQVKETHGSAWMRLIGSAGTTSPRRGN
jgi:hypothetical protein